MAKKELTQSKLKRFLNYNPETGIFTWLVQRPGRSKIGDIAGFIGRGGYRSICVCQVKTDAHRLAFLYMTGELPTQQVDHPNHIRDDNRWTNLRLASHRDNGLNQKQKNNNTSGITGVSWHSIGNKWVSTIRVDGKQIYLGLHSDFFDACCARLSANIKYGFHENHGQS